MERWGALCDAVASLAIQTVPPEEVVVVIDYNDELLDMAEASFGNVRVVGNRMTKGLSGARNTGIQESRGDLLVFLDDDAYANPDWLERLLSVFSDDQVVGCGGWIVPHWEAQRPHWFPETFLWVMGSSYDGLPEHGAVIRNPIGANMAIRREVFEAVGGFSSGLGRIGTIPLGCEETELCIRYNREHPLDKFVLVRDAIVHHRVPASRVTWSYFFRRCWSEGISKAAVSFLVGHGDGLSAERRHAALSIPREIYMSIRSSWRSPRILTQRLVALVGGSVVAAAGLLRGHFALRRHPLESEDVQRNENEGARVSWKPVEIVQVDADTEPHPIQIPETANERVWVEFTREGQVVGRKELLAINQALPRDVLATAASHYLRHIPSFVALPDAALAPISVVVPTICKHPDELGRFAESLNQLDYPVFEVILVDNRVAPTHSMPDVSSLDKVKVVAERTPGISAARNRGILEARYDIVAFTDDDVVVDSRWLRAIGGRMSARPDISALGGLVLPATLATQAQLWFEEYFGGFSHSFDFQTANLSDHSDDHLFPYAPGRYAAGCNMAYRREALLGIGGFLVSLGTGTPAFGGEDLEAMITLASRGATIAFEPAALIRHIHRETPEQFMKQVFGYGAGLTAMYAALLRRDPSHLIRMLRLAPRGLRSLVVSRETRSFGNESTYPVSTSSVERRGMLLGPLAYAKSRRFFQQRRKSVEDALGGLSRY